MHSLMQSINQPINLWNEQYIQQNTVNQSIDQTILQSDTGQSINRPKVSSTSDTALFVPAIASLGTDRPSYGFGRSTGPVAAERRSDWGWK